MKYIFRLSLACFVLTSTTQSAYSEETSSSTWFEITGVTQNPEITQMITDLRDDLLVKLDPNNPPFPVVDFGVFIAIDDIVRDGRAYFGDDLSSLPPPMAELTGHEFTKGYCGVATVIYPDGEAYAAMLADSAHLSLSEIRSCAVATFAAALGVPENDLDSITLHQLLQHE